jgi:hypothetical protein
MDAVKFMKEYKRLCDEYSACVGCPLKSYGDCIDADPEELVKVVEAWSKEHPFKTNGMRFLDDNREHIRTYHRWENGCKPYIEVHIEADWWDAEYKEER